MPDIETVSTEPGVLGEGPVWQDDTATLMWVDIVAGRAMARGYPAGDAESIVLDVNEPLSLALPTSAGGLVVAIGARVEIVTPDGQRRLLAALPAGSDVRCNDGAIGPDGNLWIGTMTTADEAGAGALYRVGPDGGVSTMAQGLTISNGIDWSPDDATMYHVDTPTRRIMAYESWRTGLDRSRVFAEIEAPGLPDGLCVDASGAVWVAIWDGWCVQRYTPDGRLDEVLEMPVQRPTAIAIGNGVAFVTTASMGLDAHALARQPLAGHVLAFPTSARGRSARRLDAR